MLASSSSDGDGGGSYPAWIPTAPSTCCSRSTIDFSSVASIDGRAPAAVAAATSELRISSEVGASAAPEATMPTIVPSPPTMARVRAPLLSIAQLTKMIILSAAQAHAAPKLLRARAAIALSAPTTSPPPLFEPRDAISLAYLSFGVGFTAINCVGAYGRYDEVCGAALAIGCVSAAAICADAVDPPPCPAIDGPGYVDRRTISRFGAAYMLGAMWVCWRTGPFWPADAGGAFAAADPLLCLPPPPPLSTASWRRRPRCCRPRSATR